MSSSTGVQTEDSLRVGRFGEARLSRIVWVSIAVTAVLRAVVILRSFYWQDDFVHIWTTWNAPASEMILQDWNGHREPLAFGMLWVVAHFWPHVWWPAALILVLLSTALPIAFWLAARGIAGVTPASATAAVGFALWPGLLIPETWFSAGLETFSLLAVIAAVAVHTRRLRWSTWLIVALLIVGFGFNERALFMLPVLFATAYLSSHGGPASRCRQAFRADTRLWVTLAVTTAALAGLAVAGSPASSGGEPAPLADVIRGLWFAGPGGLMNDVAGMNLFWPDERSTLPSGTPVWAVVLTAIVWGCLIVAAALRDAAQLAHSAGVICGFLVVETAAVAMLRGGFIGPTVHQDPRYYLITGTVLLLSVASFGATRSGPGARTAGWLMVPIAVIVVLGSLASMAGIAVTTDGTRSRSWLASARASFVGPSAPPLVPTPSPPFMLSGMFIGTTAEGVEFELGTTRTLLGVGSDQPRLMESTLFPVGADFRGAVAPVTVAPVKSMTAPGFGADCSVPTAGEWTRVPMGEAGLGNPLLAVDYLASVPSTVEVRSGGWRQSAQLEAGLKSAWFSPPAGTFAGFEIRTLTPETSICVGAARAGGAGTQDLAVGP